MKVKIEKLDHQGRGIARSEGLTIFVENALPEEVVEIELTKTKKKIAEARVIKWIQKSKNRVLPKCPYYDKCGGCHLMHLNIEEQNSYKEQKIKEILTRYGEVQEERIKTLIKNETPYYYRNKATFQVKEQLGFYQKKSYDIVPIDSCLIVHPKINEILAYLKKLSLKNITQIIVKSSDNGEYSMVVMETNGNVSKKSIQQVLEGHVTTLIINQEVVFGDGVIYEKMKDKVFQISPKSFFQVNTKMAVKLYEKVLEYASLTGKEIVYDLYCGTGTIGIFLSDKAKEVIGIEVNEDAILNANHNKEINQASNVTFYGGDVSKKIDELNQKPDVIVVDPPRAGLDIHTIQMLKKLNSKRIIYVSCDPMTLARDLKLLQENYEIKEVTPFDLFTHTYHVENVCLLERKLLWVL